MEDDRYNSKSEHAFIVSLPEKEVKFTKNESGLYIFEPPYITSKKISNNMMMDKIEDNMKFFTERQIN